MPTKIRVERERGRKGGGSREQDSVHVKGYNAITQITFIAHVEARRMTLSGPPFRKMAAIRQTSNYLVFIASAIMAR